MPSRVQTSSKQVLDRIYSILRQVLADLRTDGNNRPRVVRSDSDDSTHSEDTFTVETPEGVNLHVHCVIRCRDEERFEVRIAINGRTTHCFTFCVDDATAKPQRTAQLSRAVAALLLNEMDRPRHRTAREVPPHVPMIELNPRGDIERVNEVALRVLGYSSDRPPNPCFFSHVHANNISRVMRDLAHMVEQKIKRVRWLFRLRTSDERYRWFRAEVETMPYGSPSVILVLLRPV